MQGREKEKRRSVRVKRRLSATVEAGDKNLRGIAMNFSQHGLFVQARAMYPVNTPVVVRLPSGENQEITLQGKVASNRDARVFAGSISGGMGISLTEPSEDYFKFLSGTAVK